MDNFIKRLASLCSVKSIVTLVLTGVFAYLSITKMISQEFMMVYTVIIAFYFGTRSQKLEDGMAKKDGDINADDLGEFHADPYLQRLQSSKILGHSLFWWLELGFICC